MEDQTQIKIDKTIVLDLGSGYMKCGFGGDESPRTIFKNIVGTVRKDAVGVLNSSDKDYFVGEEAAENSSILELHYAIQDGKVHNWYAFEKCIQHALETELRVDAADYGVLLTEAPSNEVANRHKMYEIMFKTFGVLASQCQVQAILALYASGRTTGMVVDSGDGVTHTVPVYQGYARRNAVADARNAGRTINKMVLKYLNKYNGRDFIDAPNGVEIARDIKETVCRMALNYEEEFNSLKNDTSLHKKYTFADGSSAMLGELQVQAPEVIWRPKDEGIDCKNLREMLEHSISMTDIQGRLDMFENTVLSGGTTTIEGFVERTTQEYTEIVPAEAKNKVKVSAMDDRKFSVFNGGSILVELGTFQERWINRYEYEAEGNTVCDRKALF